MRAFFLPTAAGGVLGVMTGSSLTSSLMTGKLDALLPLLTPPEAVYCRGNDFAVMLCAFLAMPTGVLVVNALVWLFSPTHPAFVGVCRYLAVPLGAIALGTPLVLLLAGSSTCLTPAAIHYRAHLLAAPKVYDLSQIKAFRVSCSISKKRSWLVSLVADVGYGETVNLPLRHPSQLLSPQVMEVLRARPLDTTRIESDCHELKTRLSAAP